MAGIQNESDTSTVLCALCTPTSACFGIYRYYKPRGLPANIATCPPHCSWYQLGHSCGHRDGSALQVSFPPHSQGVQGTQLGCCTVLVSWVRGAQAPNSTCLARTMTQACTSPREPPYPKLYTGRRLQKEQVSILPSCLGPYCSLHRYSAPTCQSNTPGRICLAVQGQPISHLLGQGP